MKMRSLFFGLLAVGALASCSNEINDALEGSDVEKKVVLAFDYSSLTRAIGAPQVAGAPTLSDVSVKFYATGDGTGDVIKTLILSKEQIALLNNGTDSNTGMADDTDKKVQINAPGSANSLRIVANNLGSDSANVSKDITNYQDKDVKKAIPYEGLGKITSVVGSEGKPDYSATVEMKVGVARVEVSGIIVPAATEKYDVEIIGVYANNFTHKIGDKAAYTLQGADGEITPKTLLANMYDLKPADDATEALAAWSGAFTKENVVACAGYQLFAGSYGVTLHVKVTDKTATVEGVTTPTTKNRFIVINSFSKTNAETSKKEKIATLNAGTIYKIDLTTSGIGDLFTESSNPTSPTPDGSMAVDVTVKVAQWTVENVTPNL